MVDAVAIPTVVFVAAAISWAVTLRKAGLMGVAFFVLLLAPAFGCFLALDQILDSNFGWEPRGTSGIDHWFSWTAGVETWFFALIALIASSAMSLPLVAMQAAIERRINGRVVAAGLVFSSNGLALLAVYLNAPMA